MRVYLQKKESDLIVSFEGASSTSRERFLRENQVCLKISRAILEKRPAALIVDFRDLVLIDSLCLRAFLLYLGVLSSMMPVKLVGPGPALRRSYSVLRLLPKLRFYPTIASCRHAETQSIHPRTREWQRFLASFDKSLMRRIGVEDLGPGGGGPFVIDLEEEADYLRSERSSTATPREVVHGP